MKNPKGEALHKAKMGKKEMTGPPCKTCGHELQSGYVSQHMKNVHGK